MKLDPRQSTITSDVNPVGDADPVKGFEPVIRALLKPGAYPHPVADLQLLETHLSWVILTGPYAYKIKKPVAFGFVDFSTEALRSQACREELRLNRRLSPSATWIWWQWSVPAMVPVMVLASPKPYGWCSSIKANCCRRCWSGANSASP